MSGKKHRNKKRVPRESATQTAKTIVSVKEKKEEHESKRNDKSITEEFSNQKILATPVNIPIGVRSRLTFPLVSPFAQNHATLSSNESTDDEEDSIELNIRPRFIFVSSLCAICLEKSTLFCDRCRMVSYCSARHRAQGTAKHRSLCEPLSEIRSSLASMLSAESPMQLDAEQYRVYRLQLLAILESKAGRPLELWEREIVLYPRVCRTCLRFCDELVCCSRCGMEYFCEAHCEKHAEWCKEFQIFRRYLALQHRHGSVDPKIPNACRDKFIALEDFNFDQLASTIYGSSKYYREMDCYTYLVLSHVSTIPLTTLYAMQNCCPEWKSKTEWTVHVVGAEFQFEGTNLQVWEKLFLHFLPNLERFRLILIGPELRLPTGAPPALLSTVKLCTRCKRNNRVVTVSFRPEKLYHELTRDATECIAKPDLICAFNPGLYRKTGFGTRDTWPETIREFCKGSIPVAITAYTADEILWEIVRVKSVVEIEILLEPRRNPFASIKPDRNFVSDDVNPLIYKNYYISIIRGKPGSLLQSCV